MWAGAQTSTSTTPSALPLMTWTGSGYLGYQPVYVQGGYSSNVPGAYVNLCSITSINLSVVMPNNSSPVMAANGWAGGCNASGFNTIIPLSGVILALGSDGNPVQTGGTISSYQANLTATFYGFTNPFTCTADPTNLSLSCNYTAYQFGNNLMVYNGGGNFTLVK